MSIGPTLNYELSGSTAFVNQTFQGYDLGYPHVSNSFDYYKYNKGMPTNNLLYAGGPAFFGSTGSIHTTSTYLGFKSDDGVFRRNTINNPAQADSSTYNNNAGFNHSGCTFNSLPTSAAGGGPVTHLMFSFDWYLVEAYQRHSATGVGLRGYVQVRYTDNSTENHFWNTLHAFSGSNGNSTSDDWSNDTNKVGTWNKVALVAAVTSSGKIPNSINAFYIYMDRAISGSGVLTNFTVSPHTSFPAGPSRFLTGVSGAGSVNNGAGDLPGINPIMVDEGGFPLTFDTRYVSHNKSGPTFSFDGTDDLISGSWNSLHFGGMNIDDNTTSRTWEAVFKPDAVTGTYGVWGHKAGDGCSHYCNGGIRINGSRIQFIWFDNTSYQTIQNGADISTGKSYHVIATFNGEDSKPRLYVNGVLEATFGSATNMNYSSGMSRYNIGWNSKSGGMHYFNGEIYICKFYTGLFTQEKVTQNFKSYRKRFNI